MVVMVEQQSECMQGNGILYLKIVTKVKLMYINLPPPKKKNSRWDYVKVYESKPTEIVRSKK